MKAVVILQRIAAAPPIIWNTFLWTLPSLLPRALFVANSKLPLHNLVVSYLIAHTTLCRVLACRRLCARCKTGLLV